MSGNNFDDYHVDDEIKRALALLKYETPTKVQIEVIPKVFEHRDLIVKSQTGSGKTAAFGIPICQIIDSASINPQALVLTPTRELATQVRDDLSDIGRFKRIKTLALYGKEPIAQQIENLEQKIHIIVGTPGRLKEHIERGTFLLNEIKYLIIDEADEMLNMGFLKDVEAIITKLPIDRTTMVFSATYPKKVENICHQYMKNPINIAIASESIVTNKIEQYVIKVKESGKMSMLKNITIVENPDSCIIFCKTRERVDMVFSELEKSNYSCEKIHGGIKQNDRFSVMEGFKIGNFRYLVATDVAARGIDINNISLVVNFDIPIEKESYVHRTGRTGRAGMSGKAITLIIPSDTNNLKVIEQYIDYEIPVRIPPTVQEVAKMKDVFEKKVRGRRNGI